MNATPITGTSLADHSRLISRLGRTCRELGAHEEADIATVQVDRIERQFTRV